MWAAHTTPHTAHITQPLLQDITKIYYKNIRSAATESSHVRTCTLCAPWGKPGQDCLGLRRNGSQRLNLHLYNGWQSQGVCARMRGNGDGALVCVAVCAGMCGQQLRTVPCGLILKQR